MASAAPTLALIDRNEEAFILRNAHGDKALAAKVHQLYHDRSYAHIREQYKKDPTGIEATAKACRMCYRNSTSIREMPVRSQHCARTPSPLATLRHQSGAPLLTLKSNNAKLSAPT